ncbi:MAG: FtsQ-type POTRA domain-containing protein [Betaproteobacteria bacterium]|nr:MAG: FtsQ-type POTRA domain-containing protein [Betaproteobacteria bacterium]
MSARGRLLRAAAGFVVGFATLAVGAASAYWLAHSPLFPLRAIGLCTSVVLAPRAELEAVMARHAGGNFFAAPIDELRLALERVPWVRRAAVRRVWPHRLEVTIEEHVALARWGGEGLLNTYGERFSGTTDAALPLLSGPAGSEAELARRYLRFSQLAKPLGSPIERLALSARHAWQIRLANGIELKLGRDAEAAERRLARFVDAYAPRAAAAAGALIDLRYPNGFAVQVKG